MATKKIANVDILALLSQARAAERPVAARRKKGFEKPFLPGNEPVQILDGLFLVSVHVPFEYQDEHGSAITGRDAHKDPRVTQGEYTRRANGDLDVSGITITAGPEFDSDESGAKFPRTYIPLGVATCGLYHESVAAAARTVVERVIRADKGGRK